MTLLSVAAERVGFLQMSPAFKKWGKEEIRLHPVGTGPFKLAKWEQNQIIVLEKNPHYFKPGLPYLDRIEFKIIKEGVTRVTALRTGEVISPTMSRASWSAWPKTRSSRVKDTQRTQSYFNLRNPLFRDVRVRRAVLGYGLDRQAITKRRSWGRPSPVELRATGRADHIDFGEQFPYDPDKAKALLKEAGFDEKNPLRYTLMTHAAEAALPTIATIMKTQLAKIGVEVTIEVIDRPIFLRRLVTDRDWDQMLNFSGAALDTYSITRLIDTRAGTIPPTMTTSR